jgi:5'-3' exonuclease
MGIEGLLSRLNSISHTIHLSAEDQEKLKIRNENDRNLRVAVDASTWISAVCHAHGSDLLDERHLTNSGRHELNQQTSPQRRQHVSDIPLFIEQTTKSVMRKVKSIKFCLSPDILVVFDGASPPIKMDTVQSRKRGREEAAEQSIALVPPVVTGNDPNMNIDDIAHQTNHKKISAAKKAGARDQKIYGAVVNSVIQALREEKVTFLVSPYEADGQLAFLAKKGYIDLIVSEDSDFIPLAAPSVLYKYNPILPFMDDSDKAFSESKATGKLIHFRELMFNSDPSLILLNFNATMMSILCVASGCDYCKNLKGIGLVTAKTLLEESFLLEHSSDMDAHPLERFFSKLFQKTREKLNEVDKENYRQTFLNALMMYLHPVVFDPVQGKCVIVDLGASDPVMSEYRPYYELLRDTSKLQDIVGKVYDDTLSCHVAEGWIDPKTWNLRNMESAPSNILTFYDTISSIKEIQVLNQEIQMVDDKDGNHKNKNALSSELDESSSEAIIVLSPLESTPNKTQESQNSALSSGSKPLTQCSSSSTRSPNLLPVRKRCTL